MIDRRLGPRLRRSARSLFLLGPRQTGKSTLVAGLGPDLTINLFHEPTYLEFARNPGELEERLGALSGAAATVCIDEVQRLPSLLNTIQVLLDRPAARWRFLLTGSSARKLRRGQANLLPGRVDTYHLGPICAAEMDYRLDTRRALSTGTLPAMLTEADADVRRKTLRSYAATYLKEEVQAESLSRNLEGFARFLGIAADWAGHHLDLAKLAAGAQVARQSAARYFEVLEDTLVVQRAAPFARSPRRRLVQHPKYYFFDVGVRNGVVGGFDVAGDRAGPLFEQLVFSQLAASAAAADIDVRISSFRTAHGAEVDFIVEHGGRLWALELKASRQVGRTDLRGLRAFADYVGTAHTPLVLCWADAPRRIDGIDVLPWQDGLRAMGL